MTMTLERLKVLNQRAERVKQLERAVDEGVYVDSILMPTTRAKIDELTRQDLEAQLAEARREFEAA